MIDKRISISYIFTALLAVLTTWLLHEFAHWSTSEFLGYDTVMTLNSTYPIRGQQVSEWHQMLISAAGPIITMFQAFVVFLFLRTQWSKHLYLFLFIPFYMRLLAGIMNAISPNDEGRIGMYFGIGMYTLPLLVSASLFYLVYQTTKRYKPGKKFNGLTLLAVMIFTSLLIMADQFLRVHIL